MFNPGIAVLDINCTVFCFVVVICMASQIQCKHVNYVQGTLFSFAVVSHDHESLFLLLLLFAQGCVVHSVGEEPFTFE